MPANVSEHFIFIFENVRNHIYIRDSHFPKKWITGIDFSLGKSNTFVIFAISRPRGTKKMQYNVYIHIMTFPEKINRFHDFSRNRIYIYTFGAIWRKLESLISHETYIYIRISENVDGPNHVGNMVNHVRGPVFHVRQHSRPRLLRSLRPLCPWADQIRWE